MRFPTKLWKRCDPSKLSRRRCRSCGTNFCIHQWKTVTKNAPSLSRRRCRSRNERNDYQTRYTVHQTGYTVNPIRCTDCLPDTAYHTRDTIHRHQGGFTVHPLNFVQNSSHLWNRGTNLGLFPAQGREREQVLILPQGTLVVSLGVFAPPENQGLGFRV